MKVVFSSQRRETLLFLITDMAVVTSSANQQYFSNLNFILLLHSSAKREKVCSLHIVNQRDRGID